MGIQCPGYSPYPALLASWTNLAVEQGIYTIFKMTTYDVPGWGWANAFNPVRWQTFWENQDGQQDLFLTGWRNVWRLYASFFGQFGMGCFRIWYAYTGAWNVINADGSGSKEKLDVLSRPYPQRVAGAVQGWSFDFDSHVFEVTIEPQTEAKGSSEIFIPLRRHFPLGFVMELNGEQYFSDVDQPNGLRTASGALSAGLSFDFAGEILKIYRSDERIFLTIRPL